MTSWVHSPYSLIELQEPQERDQICGSPWMSLCFCVGSVCEPLDILGRRLDPLDARTRLPALSSTSQRFCDQDSSVADRLGFRGVPTLGAGHANCTNVCCNPLSCACSLAKYTHLKLLETSLASYFHYKKAMHRRFAALQRLILHCGREFLT